MPTIAIVGASLAGSSAAATLREEGFDGRVVLIGAEPQLPYDRPPLSKNYLRGMTPFEKTLLRSPDFYRERNIEMRLGTTVVKVDPEKRTLETIVFFFALKPDALLTMMDDLDENTIGRAERTRLERNVANMKSNVRAVPYT